ncbi:MAG: hypothetical protein ABH834_00255 [Candidatus Altiarchaeota archaeon]
MSIIKKEVNHTMNKKFLVVGFAALLIFGLVLAANASVDGKIGRFGGEKFRGRMAEGFNLPENATGPQFRGALKDRLCEGKEEKLEVLGLPENATREQVRAAVDEMRQVKRGQLDEALASGDYESWKALVGEHPKGKYLADEISQDEFPQFSQAHGKIREGKQMLEELGVKPLKYGLRGRHMMPGKCLE